MVVRKDLVFADGELGTETVSMDVSVPFLRLAISLVADATSFGVWVDSDYLPSPLTEGEQLALGEGISGAMSALDANGY